jgi:hypothetical protein
MRTKSIPRNRTPGTAFVMCISNEKYPASLELWKVYRVIPDAKGETHGLMRVVDESGEDYLYPATYFVPIRVPVAVQKAMLSTVG